MRFLLLTGLSGSGRTAALRYLEDRGAFCIDNLPPMMMLKFMETCQNSLMKCPLVAMAVDVRSGEFFDAKAVLKLIRETREIGYPIETLFLGATDETLISRYKETRRDHPLAGANKSLTEAIAEERALLQPLRENADYVIDTTGIKPRSLQKKLDPIIASETLDVRFRVEVLSFGFKRGLPRQADLVWDVRFLPNPYYIESLCRHSGLDADVRDFVMGHPTTQIFMNKARDMLDFLIPNYQEEGRHRLVIAVGCTGGAHRSVAIAEAIAAHLREMNCQVEISHRDLDVEQAHWTAPQENGR